MTIFIFCGPTLSREEGLTELDATYLSPVSQGDVFRLARRDPVAIGIVDGYFDQVPAVWHKEILWAMSRGIHVYGSASMGALRAAELAPFGMQGVGSVFESFRSGTLEDDDEVAVVHGLEESGYRCMSEAMVNIRATLDAAEAAEVISASTHSALTAIAKATFYPERSYGSLLRSGAKHALPSAELEALREWLPHGAVNIKREDAVAMLRLMRRQLTDRPVVPKQVEYRMEHTDFWSHVMRSETEGRRERKESPTALPSDAVLEELRLQGAPYIKARDQGLLRDLALSEAQRLGHGAGYEAVRAAAAHLRGRLGISGDEDFTRWLRENHVTAERFEAMARAEGAVDKLNWSRAGGQHLVDHLRVTGRYRSLYERVLDKQRRLAAAGLDQPTLGEVGVTREELLMWYFDRLGPLYPPNAKRHAETFGFEEVEALVEAVLREYCYLRLHEQSDEPTLTKSGDDGSEGPADDSHTVM